MLPTKIFDRSHLKVAPELQDEIIRRFNNYDLLVRVMTTVSANINTIRKITTEMPYQDRQDLYYLANLLKDATDPNWQTANHLYF